MTREHAPVPAMTWPLETVRLLDACGSLVDDWIGYLTPLYLGGLPNSNASVCYSLEFGCGFILYLCLGDLGNVVWDALMVHGAWCMAENTPPMPGKVDNLSTLI